MSSFVSCLLVLYLGVFLLACSSNESKYQESAPVSGPSPSIDKQKTQEGRPGQQRDSLSSLAGGASNKPLHPQKTGTLLPKEVVQYYQKAHGLEGDVLKRELHGIVKGHAKLTYKEVYDALMELDEDIQHPGKVLCIYSGFLMDAQSQYDDGEGWNREHVWAKSYGDFGTSPGPGTDLHHLRAADISTNEARNNRAFDESDKEYVDLEGKYKGSTGSNYSDDAWTWEPPDRFKGDIARMMFYMDVRYEGRNGELDLQLVDETPPRNSKMPVHGKLSTLLQWHRQDPVDAWETRRNDLIFRDYQHNRNPFIDYPDFVEKIWGQGL